MKNKNEVFDIIKKMAWLKFNTPELRKQLEETIPDISCTSEMNTIEIINKNLLIFEYNNILYSLGYNGINVYENFSKPCNS